MALVRSVKPEFLVVTVVLVFVKEVTMTPTTKKRKGAHLQNLVRDKILKAFPHLKPNDIVTAKNGQNGPDLKLSKVARRLVGVNFECKHQNKLSTVYSWYAQASQGQHKLIPCVVMKKNSRKALAVIDLDDFFKLIKE
jgi:hypothetical protein